MSTDPVPSAADLTPPDRLASLAEVAAYTNMAERTVRGWLSRGLVAAYKRPDRNGLFFDLDEIDQAVALMTSRRPYGPEAVVRMLPEDFDVAAAR